MSEKQGDLRKRHLSATGGVSRTCRLLDTSSKPDPRVPPRCKTLLDVDGNHPQRKSQGQSTKCFVDKLKPDLPLTLDVGFFRHSGDRRACPFDIEARFEHGWDNSDAC